jgi:alpha-tubulin suppressor-like RCC1 family protein
VTNEIQTLSLTGNSLSISGANTITLTDTDPTNEIQDISLNGSNLTISGGSTIDLSNVSSGGGGSNTSNPTPTVGASGVKMVKLVEAQCQHDILGTAYIGADDNIWAHGYGNENQYGVPGLTTNSFKPHIEPVNPINGAKKGKWTHVFTTRNALWAITDSGEVFRRGQDLSGAMGNGTSSGNILYLTKMAYFDNNNIKVKYLYISPNSSSANPGTAVFAVSDIGDVYSWGENAVGQLGIGNTTDQQTPLIITTLQGRNIVKMTQSGGGAGGVSVAAISGTGQLYTWGYNAYGQLGTGSTSNFTSPQLITGVNAQDIIMRRWSWGATLLINSAGNVLGAGYNAYGIIGDGTTASKNAFTQTSTIFTNAKEVHMGVGNYTGAVVTTNGDLYVAGYNAHRALGLGLPTTTVLNYTMPSAPFQGMVKKVVTQAWGSYKSIHVLDTLGRIWACGDNLSGQLATGGIHDQDPAGVFVRAMDELSGAVKFVDIQPIGHFRNDYMSMVALTDDGRVMTTGASFYGQSGNGTNNAQGPAHRYYKLIDFN